MVEVFSYYIMVVEYVSVTAHNTLSVRHKINLNILINQSLDINCWAEKTSHWTLTAGINWQDYI